MCDDIYFKISKQLTLISRTHERTEIENTKILKKLLHHRRILKNTRVMINSDADHVKYIKRFYYWGIYETGSRALKPPYAWKFVPISHLQLFSGLNPFPDRMVEKILMRGCIPFQTFLDPPMCTTFVLYVSIATFMSYV